MSNETVKFEFLLTLGKNIVCQRYFTVKSFNQKASRSYDLYEYVKNICEEIQHDLKIKTSDYLTENQGFYLNSDEIVSEEINEKEFFTMEIRRGEEVFITRAFPAHYYHPKVRYTVDIRPQLKEILNDLSDLLSLKKPVVKYLNYDLV